MTHPKTFAVFVLLALSSLSCEQREQGVEQVPLASAERPEVEAESEAEPVANAEIAQLSREARATAADQALRQRLLGRVMEVASADGLGAAVTVCQKEAIPITEEVGDEFQVSIGRFSDRLRNEENQAPQWALEMIPQDKESALRGAITREEQTFQRVSPLQIAAPCLGCHGETQSLSEEVQSALSRYYPNDQATGYQEGDLRGWVWVEVP